MTHQRRHGPRVVVYASASTTDRRGNEVQAATETVAYVGPASTTSTGSGEYTLGINGSADLAGVDVWSRVELLGGWYDVTEGPTLSGGPRSTRHWTLKIRRRQDQPES